MWVCVCLKEYVVGEGELLSAVHVAIHMLPALHLTFVIHKYMYMMTVIIQQTDIKNEHNP